MDVNSGQDYKLNIKQRIAQAKIRAAEKRAAEQAARQAEHQAINTPSPTPFSAPSFSKNPTPSVSNNTAEPRAFFRSPTTKNERIARAKSLEILSKKIDGAGNFKLQELVMIMILKYPRAREIAESFFVLNDVRCDNEEHHMEQNHSRRHGDDDGCQDVDHVTSTAGFRLTDTLLELLETEDSTDIRHSNSNYTNTRQDATGNIHRESEMTKSASRTSREMLDTTTSNAAIANMPNSDLQEAFNDLRGGKATSCELRGSDPSSRVACQAAIQMANKDETTPALGLPSSDTIPLASELSAVYLNLARKSGSGDFSHERLASISDVPSLNDSTNEFSLETFNGLVDSNQENIEGMQKISAADRAPETSENSFVREIPSSLEIPIPIDANSQDLTRNSSSGDGTDSVAQETVVNRESTDSEDDYSDLLNTMSGHYNCDICRKPIVLPEGLVATAEIPLPSTCLHCATRKASGITRRKLGGARPNSGINVPGSIIDDLPGSVGQDGTENAQMLDQPLVITSEILEPLSEQPQQLLLRSIEKNVRQSLSPLQAEERISNEMTLNPEVHAGCEIKEEVTGDAIIVEGRAWQSSVSPYLSEDQLQTHGQSIPRKRKVEKIEGEVVYPYPIGPKRRCGRPLKNWNAILLDSPPNSFPPHSTPTSRQSSIPETPMTNSSSNTPSKKRGRPIGSKNRIKLESWSSDKVMEQSAETREKNQRRSALRSRELIQGLYNEYPEIMQDVAFGTEPFQTPGSSESPIRPPTVTTRSTMRSTIPSSKATSVLNPRTFNLDTRKDSDSEYVPSQGSGAGNGGSLVASTTLTTETVPSFKNAPAGIVEESGSKNIAEIQNETSNTHDLSLTIDQHLQQSMEGQDRTVCRQMPRDMTISSGDIVGSGASGLSEIVGQRIDREVESIMDSMMHKIQRSFDQGSDLMASSEDKLANDSNIPGASRYDKRGLAAQNPVLDQIQSHRRSSCFTLRKDSALNVF